MMGFACYSTTIFPPWEAGEHKKDSLTRRRLPCYNANGG